MIFSSSSSSSPLMDLDQEEPTSKKPKHSSGGGSSLEAAKRPRGRPPGSKNKPRPPTVITREPEPSSSAAMRPHLLEIAPGRDIVASLSDFSARRNLGLCVLAATGSVSNVTLRQQPDGAALALRGSFEILSMSAAFLAPGGVRSPPVTVLLAGPGGRVVGGTVVGPVVAAGTAAMVVAAGFGSAEFHRLPDEDEDDVSAHRQQHEQQEEDGDHDDFDTPPPAMNSGGMSMDYSSHLPAAESIWALGPAPRHYSS